MDANILSSLVNVVEGLAFSYGVRLARYCMESGGHFLFFSLSIPKVRDSICFTSTKLENHSTRNVTQQTKK